VPKCAEGRFEFGALMMDRGREGRRSSADRGPVSAPRRPRTSGFKDASGRAFSLNTADSCWKAQNDRCFRDLPQYIVCRRANSSCRCVPADQVSKTVHKGAHNVEVCRLLNRGLLDKIPSLLASMRKNRIDSCWVQGVSILAGFAS
jgi:hypothetical protein